eukprot:CAMPEP_0185723732 /NCGR_PEP_ID=MMETSP1171-20130828/471_1 /TAXON_ID=374046 /ORGANISM="Helicotheca tamensis, Strain CCMP826" /LENGTH=377 /DNA_ID=CAMNT_0028391479 /DNA_START=228 /DNA_END=1361 /DNA_ORIENTATION=+
MRLVTALLLLLSITSNDAFSFVPASQRVTSSSQSFSYSAAGIRTTSNHPLQSSTTAVNGDATATTTTTDDDDSEEENKEINIFLNVNEKARTVLSVCTSGTLCTTSNHEGIQGAPFGSFVDFVLDDEGCPVLLMSDLSMHTKNILDGNKNIEQTMVTLFAQIDPFKNNASGNEGQDVSRVSFTATVQRIDADNAEDYDALRMRYSIAHKYADQVMDSPRFDFYRLIPQAIYYVGGFGVLSKWVDVEEYKSAVPDILANEASDIVSKLNSMHTDDLFLTAQHLLEVQDVEKVRVTGVDRLGMDVRVTSRQGARRNKMITDEFRIGFRIPVISVEDAKSEVLKVFQEAWEKGKGVTWGGEEEMPGSTVPIMKIAEDSLE